MPTLRIYAMSHPEDLDEKEQARVAFIFRMFYNQYNKIFHLFRTGVLDEKEWTIYAKQAGWFFGSRGGRIFMERNTDFPEFAKAINPYLRDPASLEFSFCERDTPNKSRTDSSVNS